MDKIRDLLKQLGASDDLAGQIVSEMQGWKDNQQKALTEEYRNRLERAKQVCVEEVESYKREVARKVEIFLESQVAAVERGSRERLAIEESESVNKLKQVKAMLEGIKFDGTAEDLQAVQAENEKLRQQLVMTTEDRDKLKGRYEQVHGIAQKVLKRNQVLEGKVATRTKKPVAEGKKKRGTKLQEARRPRGRVRTTRRTLTESQVPSKPTSSGGKGDAKIESIASQIHDIA